MDTSESVDPTEGGIGVKLEVIRSCRIEDLVEDRRGLKSDKTLRQRGPMTPTTGMRLMSVLV